MRDGGKCMPTTARAENTLRGRMAELNNKLDTIESMTIGVMSALKGAAVKEHTPPNDRGGSSLVSLIVDANDTTGVIMKMLEETLEEI